MCTAATSRSASLPIRPTARSIIAAAVQLIAYDWRQALQARGWGFGVQPTTAAPTYRRSPGAAGRHAGAPAAGADRHWFSDPAAPKKLMPRLDAAVQPRPAHGGRNPHPAGDCQGDAGRFGPGARSVACSAAAVAPEAQPSPPLRGWAGHLVHAMALAQIAQAVQRCPDAGFHAAGVGQGRLAPHGAAIRGRPAGRNARARVNRGTPQRRLHPVDSGVRLAADHVPAHPLLHPRHS